MTAMHRSCAKMRTAVFAREMDPDANRLLTTYFRDRTHWLLQPDRVDSRPIPYLP
jgi:hypothetical protein